MKLRSVLLLLLAEVAAMSLWFVSAAVLPDMLREMPVSPAQQAALSSGVQAGFVVGALGFAFFGIADRFDPRRVFAISAVLAGLCNAALLVTGPDSILSVLARFATGALLAGVYPVGMKLVVGWGREDRGFLVGSLVAALTLGSAAPHLFSLAGGPDWRMTVAAASLAAIAGGILCLAVRLGPFHAKAPRFDPTVITAAWTNRRVRYAYGGYLGHMWELYAMWAWIAVAMTASFAAHMPAADAETAAKLLAFIAIAAGGLASAFAGRVADRIGKAEVAIIAMVVSGTAALLTGLTFGGPVWISFLVVIIWGISIIPDSAQFSALVADASPPEYAGSLMTFQTALGFTLTFFTVQIAPMAANAFGWGPVLASLAIGPALGIWSMLRLKSLGPG